MVKYRNLINAPLEKKLYQLIISRLEGKDIQSPHYQDRIVQLVQNGIGGFILFGGGKDDVRHFIQTLQRMSELPLFIASDIERGVGQQVHNTTIFPCQMAVAAATDRLSPRDVGTLEQAIQSVASEAQHIGINMPLIPVLDVNKEPDNPIICTRAFSDDPEVVSWFGIKYIEILEKAGLVSCAKHFPGHGDTSIDSHISLPVIKKSYEDLISSDIVPFRSAINHGVSSIMIGHLSIPAIDALPSSLSREIYLLLRNELGFEGLILTDALTMSALNDIPDAAVCCLNAGADILLHPADPDETVKKLSAAFLSGQIHKERIDTALTRVIKKKSLLSEIATQHPDYRAHADVSTRIADKSVSLVKFAPDVLPVVREKNIHIFIAGEQEHSYVSPLRTLSRHVRMLHEYRDDLDLRNSTAVIAVFTTIAAWKGSSGVSEDEKQQIRKIISSSHKSIVLSFGNPYVLRYFPGSDILVAAYEATDQSQKKVIEWLTGSGRLEGRIPVRLL